MGCQVIQTSFKTKRNNTIAWHCWTRHRRNFPHSWTCHHENFEKSMGWVRDFRVWEQDRKLGNSSSIKAPQNGCRIHRRDNWDSAQCTSRAHGVCAAHHPQPHAVHVNGQNEVLTTGADLFQYYLVPPSSLPTRTPWPQTARIPHSSPGHPLALLSCPKPFTVRPSHSSPSATLTLKGRLAHDTPAMQLLNHASCAQSLSSTATLHPGPNGMVRATSSQGHTQHPWTQMAFYLYVSYRGKLY